LYSQRNEKDLKENKISNYFLSKRNVVFAGIISWHAGKAKERRRRVGLGKEILYELVGWDWKE
jgi:hypothetical protein